MALGYIRECRADHSIKSLASPKCPPPNGQLEVKTCQLALGVLSALGTSPSCVFRLRLDVLYLDLSGGSSARALGIPVSANPRTRGLNSPWQSALLCFCFGDEELLSPPWDTAAFHCPGETAAKLFQAWGAPTVRGIGRAFHQAEAPNIWHNSHPGSTCRASAAGRGTWQWQGNRRGEEVGPVSWVNFHPGSPPSL